MYPLPSYARSIIPLGLGKIVYVFSVTLFKVVIEYFDEP